MWAHAHHDADSPRTPLQCVWHPLCWIRLLASFGGLGDPRTAREHFGGGGPSGLVCWGARFGGLVDLRHHWVDSWTSEPLNIISSQVDFGVQPGGLHCFWVLFCKNPSGLPGGLAPLRSPPLFLQGFRMASGRSIWGSRGSLCSPLLVRTVASVQLDPFPLGRPTTLFSSSF